MHDERTGRQKRWTFLEFVSNPRMNILTQQKSARIEWISALGSATLEVQDPNHLTAMVLIDGLTLRQP